MILLNYNPVYNTRAGRLSVGHMLVMWSVADISDILCRYLLCIMFQAVEGYRMKTDGDR